MDSKLLMIGGGAAVAVLIAALAFTGNDEAPAKATKETTVAESKPAAGETTSAAGTSTPAASEPAKTEDTAAVGSLKAAPVHGIDTPEAKALKERGFLIGDVALGKADAPVTMVEYASTTCPHCASFHINTLPELKKKYIETGKMRLIIREVYFNEPNLWSSLLARCAGPEQYHAFMDVLFERQENWASGDGAAIAANLRQLGRLAGLSAERIETCLNDPQFNSFMINRYRVEAQADGVRSTPHFNIAGETVTGARSIEEFSRIIDSKLGE